MKKPILLILCGWMCLAYTAFAQQQKHWERIFFETQRPYFHDPGAPRFLLVDRQNRWALGIGGYVQGKAEVDFGGVCRDIDFYPSAISGSVMSNQFQMDATTSTVFLKLVGHTSLGNVVVYTAANWRNADYGMQLQNAYVQYLGFTLGYDTGTLMDLAACPPTIDFAGPAGMTFYRTTLLRYEHTFGSALTACLGIEVPAVSADLTANTNTDIQRLPDIPAYLQYAWKGGASHVRVGAMLRNMSYVNTATDCRSSETGFGVQASTILKLNTAWQLFGQYTYGKGIGSMMNDISNLNIDLVPDYEEEGRLTLLGMQGWYAGAQYNVTPNLFASATYSQSAVFSEHAYDANNPAAYKRGRYLVGNVFWNATPALQLGVEYLHGWRKDFNDESHQANRINLSAQFNF